MVEGERSGQDRFDFVNDDGSDEKITYAGILASTDFPAL